MTHDVKDRPSAFPWPPVLFAGCLAGGWVAGQLVPARWHWLPAAVTGPAGGGLIAAGVLIALWAGAAMMRARTTVLPHAKASALVATGPFRISRNPMYLSEVLILFGLSLLMQNPWLAGAAFLFKALVTRLAIIPEERHLEARFGSSYRSYAGRTRRWI